MTNKFEIGSQWKTRGGWRAVVVKRNNDGLYVWHDRDDNSIWDGDFVCCHRDDGAAGLPSGNCDLISPWVEPKEYDVWVNVYGEEWGNINYLHLSKQTADEKALPERIACLNLKFKEGDGL